jgi:nitrogen regulatory protein PII
MKLIIGIIKPFKLDEVFASLSDLGIEGVNVTEVKGFGRQKGIKEHYHGAEYAVDFIDKIQLEFIVSDELLEKATATVQSAAYSGIIGDGKVFVYALNE